MELQGKVIAETPERSGTSARGEWKVKGYVIETHEQYPKKMVFEVFGADRLARFNIQVGQEVLVSFDIDAREYNGRWYNQIRAYAAKYCMTGYVNLDAENNIHLISSYISGWGDSLDYLKDGKYDPETGQITYSLSYANQIFMDIVLNKEKEKE